MGFLGVWELRSIYELRLWTMLSELKCFVNSKIVTQLSKDSSKSKAKPIVLFTTKCKRHLLCTLQLQGIYFKYFHFTTRVLINVYQPFPSSTRPHTVVTHDSRIYVTLCHIRPLSHWIEESMRKMRVWNRRLHRLTRNVLRR